MGHLDRSFLYAAEHGAQLDRYLALLDEDQALRDAEYARPDPTRRRLRIACNDCTAPACCNQRVDVNLVEALVIYRHAAEHARRQLAEALRRGDDLRRRPPADDGAFFRRRTPCPFLDRGRCTIYRARPLACREHYMAGNPNKCRDELAPTDTYGMNPDPTLIAELRQVAEDYLFFTQIESVEPRELSETLRFIDKLLDLPRWTRPRPLAWSAVADE